MKYIVCIFCTLFFLDGYAQKAQREVIASGGNSIQVDQISVSYTVGQPIAGSNSNSRFSVIEGFQRGLLEIVTSTPEALYPTELNIYPNPAHDEVQILARLPKAVGISARLYNLSGQIVATQTHDHPQSEHHMTLDLRTFAKGFYMLILLDENGQRIRAFQIQKHL